MLLRKNISLWEEDLKKLEPILKKHKGNFSAAIREVIDFTHSMIEMHGSIENAKASKISKRERFIENKEGLIVPFSILKWLLRNSRGIIPSLDVVELADFLKNIPPTKLEKVINDRNKMLGIPVKVILHWDGEEKIELKINGLDEVLNDIFAILQSLCLLERSYKIISSKKGATSIEITYAQSESKEESYNSIIEHFGYNQAIYNALSNKHEFWNNIITSYELLNYNLINIPKEVFESLVSGNEYATGIEFFELRSGKFFKDIPFNEFLSLFRRVIVNTGLVSKIEYDEEKILVYHCFKNKKVTKLIDQWLYQILSETGYKFEMECFYGSTVYKFKKVR